METTAFDHLQVIWDYMHMNMTCEKADCIIGFGNINEDIPIRVAELYQQGYAKKVLFTGGLGRNTDDLWVRSEAERFADIAMAHGVPSEDILLETKSSNTAENILFTKQLLDAMGMQVSKLIGVHQQFMERRIYAALKVYWAEMDFIITSPQVSIDGYLQLAIKQGLSEQSAIEVIVGDFQRMEIYAKKGYQIPQYIPPKVQASFEAMVALGYTGQLI